jgi:hypothetical protein
MISHNRSQPTVQQTQLSFHAKRSRWTIDGQTLTLQCVGRGQEFVVAAHPPWRSWVAEHVPEAAY